VIVDRPHSEPLGIAATQGLLGLAAWLLLMGSAVRTFWRSRRDLESIALFGGFLAALTYLLFNFSWLPSSLPFWMFLAAAVSIWHRPGGRRVGGLKSGIGAIAVGVAAIFLMAVRPYAADVTYHAAIAAAVSGERQSAQSLVDHARELAPWQSTYAVAAGNLALNLQSNGQAGTGADYVAARSDFLQAGHLGSVVPATYRYLAMADAALGRHAEAIAAARMAVQLGRYDPANMAELTRLLD
jgi:tetratricopeptide (TPR) repeat protein